jgi:thiol-disulfide isomerase/thioredoxin
MIEVWTFGCSNCIRTIPWLRQMDERYGGRGLLVLGVHAPEFDYEREPGRVRRFVSENDILFPVVLDNEMRYWRSLGNRYWPTTYLVDRSGRIRHVHVGETRSGSRAADHLERIVESLLAEERQAASLGASSSSGSDCR